MKVPAIRKLLPLSIEDLRQAELDLTEEKDLKIEVEGEDEGEKLTHIFGAIWVKEQVAAGNMEERHALRAFCDKVRNSIS